MNSDHKVNDVVSALVMIAAVLITASVYTTYSDEKSVSMYEEVESSYTQTASIYMGLKALKENMTQPEGASEFSEGDESGEEMSQTQ